jgi:ribulose-phosphate 3-epimerase
MKISASIYAQSALSLPALANQMEQLHVDYYHVDSIENKAVFADIKTLNECSAIPIDLHLITENPQEYYTLINSVTVDAVAFQYESFNTVINFKAHIHNCKVGIAVLNGTPLSVINDYLPYIDFVLLMTTTPGVSGGAFSKETFKKIRHVKAQFPQLAMRVDGGVTPEVSFVLRNMGVESAVVGSYLFKTNTIGEALINLRLQHTQSHYVMQDIMIDADELPVITSDTATLLEVLTVIENYKLGFALCVNAQGTLQGIISNADVRKAIIKNYNNITQLTAATLLNSKPLVIQADSTITQLLALVRTQQFPVMYLPVINPAQQLVGALTFNNLIKGE